MTLGAAAKAINEGAGLQETYRQLVSKGLINPKQTSVNEYRNTYNRLKSRSSSNPWDRSIAYASSVAERKALFAEMPAEERARFAAEYNTDTGEKRTTARSGSTGIRIRR